MYPASAGKNYPRDHAGNYAGSPLSPKPKLINSDTLRKSLYAAVVGADDGHCRACFGSKESHEPKL